MPAHDAPAPRPDQRYHISTFAIGERFRYAPDGPDFVRVGDPKGPILVKPAESKPTTPPAKADPQTFVYAIDPPSGSDSGFWAPVDAREGGGS